MFIVTEYAALIHGPVFVVMQINNHIYPNKGSEHNLFKILYPLENSIQISWLRSDEAELIRIHSFYTPPHFSVGVLCYTFRCLSVCPSVHPCSPFPIDNLSIYSRNFFKFCIHIVIGDEWYGIVNGQNPPIFNGVTALFRIGKMVSGLLFLYCS